MAVRIFWMYLLPDKVSARARKLHQDERAQSLDFDYLMFPHGELSAGHLQPEWLEKSQNRRRPPIEDFGLWFRHAFCSVDVSGWPDGYSVLGIRMAAPLDGKSISSSSFHPAVGRFGCMPKKVCHVFLDTFPSNRGTSIDSKNPLGRPIRNVFGYPIENGHLPSAWELDGGIHPP